MSRLDRWRLWPAGAPGTVWIVALFAVPFYAIAAIAFGGPTRSSTHRLPEWNPATGTSTTFADTLSQSSTARFAPVFIRTGVYVFVALVAVHR